MQDKLNKPIEIGDKMLRRYNGEDLPKVSEEDFIEYMQVSQKALKIQEKLNEWILGDKGNEFRNLAWDSEELRAILSEFTIKGY